jgi:hypothetical protein
VTPGDEPRPRRRPFVRPYALTWGRTEPARSDELELETLVAVNALGEASLDTLILESHEIVLLCREILSVVEIAARLDVPLGVARVLVGDLAERGLVDIHRPLSPSDRPDLALLERVLYGLREI